MITLAVTAVLLLWVLATLPLAVAVGRAFDAGSPESSDAWALRSAAARPDVA